MNDAAPARLTTRELRWPVILLWTLWIFPLGLLAFVCFTLIRMGDDMLANPPLEYLDDAAATSPPFYDPSLLDIARVLSWTAICAIGAVLLASIISLVRLRAGVIGIAALVAAAPLSVAPAVIRVFLPWEDAWTGAGSPMASLIGIVFLAGFFLCIVGAPAIGLAVLVMRRNPTPRK